MALCIVQNKNKTPDQAEKPTVIVSHFDVHGVCAGYLATKAFNAGEVYANFPQKNH